MYGAYISYQYPKVPWFKNNPRWQGIQRQPNLVCLFSVYPSWGMVSLMELYDEVISERDSSLTLGTGSATSVWDRHVFYLRYTRGFGSPQWHERISHLSSFQWGKYAAEAENGEDANSTAHHSITLCCWLATKSHMVLSVSSGKFLSVLLMRQAVPWYLLYHSKKQSGTRLLFGLFIGLFITILHSRISTFVRVINLFST